MKSGARSLILSKHIIIYYTSKCGIITKALGRYLFHSDIDEKRTLHRSLGHVLLGFSCTIGVESATSVTTGKAVINSGRGTKFSFYVCQYMSKSQSWWGNWWWEVSGASNWSHKRLILVRLRQLSNEFTAPWRLFVDPSCIWEKPPKLVPRAR